MNAITSTLRRAPIPVATILAARAGLAERAAANAGQSFYFEGVVLWLDAHATPETRIAAATRLLAGLLLQIVPVPSPPPPTSPAPLREKVSCRCANHGDCREECRFEDKA